jgi:hypothetical protein
MENKEILEQLERKLQKVEAQEACRNLMGRYSYFHTAFRNREYVELWAKREDDVLVMPWGTYEGFEGVKKCYLEDHGDRSDAKVLESMRGAVMMHEIDTEVIEVAEDLQTAKAAFFSQGHETWVEHEESGIGLQAGKEGTAHAEWAWSKYAVDFIREDGEWKIWHMRLYPVFKSEYGKSWVDAVQPAADDYSFENARKNKAPMWHYDANEVYPGNEPEPPKAYKTFADVGITFEY